MLLIFKSHIEKQYAGRDRARDKGGSPQHSEDYSRKPGPQGRARKSKKVGGQDITAATYYQKVDYTYNIRGWLKGINDVNELQKTGEPLDLFAFKINYQDNDDHSPNEENVDKLYNGNISETYWRTSSDNVLRKYGYHYDALSRLNGAIYQKPDAGNVSNVWVLKK